MRSNPKSSKVKDVLYLEDLARLLGVTSPDDYSEGGQDYLSEVYGQALHYAEQEGMTEAEAEAYAQKVEYAEADDGYRKYKNAVESVAEKVFGEHDLVLTELKKGGYKVEPSKSWRDSAWKIIDTINGVGMFEFRNVKEFLDSGPYTPREGVLSHLGWLKDRSDVYGDPSPKRRFESAMGW